MNIGSLELEWFEYADEAAAVQLLPQIEANMAAAEVHRLKWNMAGESTDKDSKAEARRERAAMLACLKKAEAGMSKLPSRRLKPEYAARVVREAVVKGAAASQAVVDQFAALVAERGCTVTIERFGASVVRAEREADCYRMVIVVARGEGAGSKIEDVTIRGWEESIAQAIEHYRDLMLNNNFRAATTSSMSNAVQNEQREAVSSWLRYEANNLLDDARRLRNASERWSPEIVTQSRT